MSSYVDLKLIFFVEKKLLKVVKLFDYDLL